jgi:hypothetical protein
MSAVLLMRMGGLTLRNLRIGQCLPPVHGHYPTLLPLPTAQIYHKLFLAYQRAETL